MIYNIYEFTIVLIGELHNPTIINQDFLTIQNIIPEEWGWEVAEPIIITPPLVRIPYKTDVLIKVEPNRAVFNENREVDPTKSELLHIAKSYVNTLKHIRYKAVGLNFKIVSEHPDPKSFITKKFYKKGEWFENTKKLSGIGITLRYDLNETKATFKLDSGFAEHRESDQKEIKEVILGSANFHNDIKIYPSYEKVTKIISKVNLYWKFYKKFLGNL